ncbi:MAG: efflux RND transporter periplasmic adaptor subunit [Bryobacteraceae bacterium]|nr:efflux RND transporter periplasmic adaptor subunit [Bryobacteraceae bacterium]
MKARIGWILAALALMAAIAWTIRRILSAPPEIAFAAVMRGELANTLATNGKVEPVEFVLLRAEREGTVARVAVERGQRVDRGSVLADLEDAEARAELAAAEARVAAARAALEVIQAGGRAAELAEIQAALERTRLEVEQAARELQSLENLLARQAATAQEVRAARERLESARAERMGLEQKRTALVSVPDRNAAQARLREAEAARDQAALRLAQCRIRSPLEGIVYELRIRRGDYVRAGDPVASVGRLDPVRVRVYVDEPELGRLAPGLPVTITWDARPDRRWHGSLEQLPLQVTALGTRQVGEVLLTVANPAHDLLPGANVNAEIRTQLIRDGLIIPREAVRRRSEETGVWILAGDRLRWRPVRLGASSLTRTQVLEGLREGELVALGPGDGLADGLRVRPVAP